MSDKPIAILVTSLLAVPIVVICCLGPVIVFSALAGVISWSISSNMIVALVGVLVVMFSGLGLINKYGNGAKSRTDFNAASDTDAR